MAMEGNLHEVNGETIRSELERRGEVEPTTPTAIRRIANRR